jgi:putative transposase
MARRDAYAPKGQRVYGLVAGHQRPRTSLIAARLGAEFVEPFLFTGTCTAAVCNDGLERQLCPRLDASHVVVLDHGSFHKGAHTKALTESQGAVLLPLPPYAPDLHPIEHDFAALKKIREYAQHQTLDAIVQCYQ